jgi:hypothetical protein
MRFNFRVKLGNVTFFTMISKTQTLKGITSKIAQDKHIIMWDLENCTLEQAEQTLNWIQHKYNLSDIRIYSDIKKSFRAICFNVVSFRKLLQILFDTDYVDFNFIHWAVVRGKATIRTSNKLNRKPQILVSILHSYHISLPQSFELCKYDTGIQKSGLNILLGDK